MAKTAKAVRKPASEKSRKQLIVTVTDAMQPSIERVASELEAKGMKVGRVNRLMGAISGSCPASKLPALEAVEGVLSVEEELHAEPST